MISDQLKKAIEECGQSRYRISQETGIEEAALSRFVNGKRGLTLETVDRLADYFGLRLTKSKGK